MAGCVVTALTAVVLTVAASCAVGCVVNLFVTFDVVTSSVVGCTVVSPPEVTSRVVAPVVTCVVIDRVDAFDVVV